ncbi:YdcF family protein [Acinetobacter guerrae]|uniref:YdcF family protein n=1 Tax=Acinetobacter guerrae TaxID=1843371 RepID=A0A3A8F2W2_9GAMM|nr:YdcF family protein [Acinetobacter guerrae]RKG35471.1 YdcF family protein [Acinetobacter guerrae]
MSKTHWMIRFVRVVGILFVLFACLVVFIYTPFYSKLIVKALNYFVPVEVNQVAAKSQQQASLSEHDNLEPGSNLWIARQAYLSLIENALNSKDSQSLALLQTRYKLLQERIIEQQKKEDAEEPEKPAIPLLKASVSEPEQVLSSSEPELESSQQNPLLDLNSSESKALMQQYVDFLQKHPVPAEHDQVIDQQTTQDIALVKQNQNDEKLSTHNKPYAIVVLGGGLTLDENKKDIVVNPYTRLRLEKTLELHNQNHLPIVLSGVEAPYMQKWLKVRGVDAKLLENRSMNTCENTRFSSLLLQKKGGAPTVMLVTDIYHMPRTRRLFALNGIETIPVEAPMPTQLTAWQPSQQNYDHSRRANYELLATIRDVLFGSSGCREVP